MSEPNWMKPSDLYRVVCRPALPKDTPDVMELTRTIWEGNDYVPSVWEDWLADPQGLLAVAEYGGHVVGLGKLTLLSPADWWMEGMRVHPDFEGRRIASRLHDYLLDYWQRNGDGMIGLATASFRASIHHLCERTEFQKIGEFSTHTASVLQNPETSLIEAEFHTLDADELPVALEFTLKSPGLALAYGLMDLGWEWSQPKVEYLAEAARREMAWWWHGDQGLLLAREDTDDDGEKQLYIQLTACPPEAMVSCLQDFRRMAANLGYTHVSWMAPLHPDLTGILQGAGFQREWDASIYIFQKKHPSRSRVKSAMRDNPMV